MPASISNCNIITNLSSLRFCKGKPLAPGLRPHLYCIRKKNITAWPRRNDLSAVEPTSDGLRWYGSFTLDADMYWQRIDLVEDAGTLSWESQGGKYSRTFRNTLDVRFPDPTDPFAAYVQSVCAVEDMVYLVPDRLGNYYVLGNDLFETETTPSGTFGEGADSDDLGATFHAEVTDIYPPLIYEGPIVTQEDGTIHPATGN